MDGRVDFNSAGNKYRLVAFINSPYGIIFVKFVGTHKQYDAIDTQTLRDFMYIKPIRTEADYHAALRDVESLMTTEFGIPDGDRLDVLQLWCKLTR
jgi:hypothetical protein